MLKNLLQPLKKIQLVIEIKDQKRIAIGEEVDMDEVRLQRPN
jgi:hypothetical protein